MAASLLYGSLKGSGHITSVRYFNKLTKLKCVDQTVQSSVQHVILIQKDQGDSKFFLRGTEATR